MRVAEGERLRVLNASDDFRVEQQLVDLPNYSEVLTDYLGGRRTLSRQRLVR